MPVLSCPEGLPALLVQMMAGLDPIGDARCTKIYLESVRDARKWLNQEGWNPERVKNVSRPLPRKSSVTVRANSGRENNPNTDDPLPDINANSAPPRIIVSFTLLTRGNSLNTPGSKSLGRLVRRDDGFRIPSIRILLRSSSRLGREVWRC